jgi:hypothetical protein
MQSMIFLTQMTKIMKGVEMSDIDWRGIALAINQLSQIAEPSRMDLMKQEEVIRANREKKDRAFETAKFQFETMFEQNKDLEKELVIKKWKFKRLMQMQTIYLKNHQL